MTYIPFSWQSGSVLLRQQSRENIEGVELGVSIAHAAVILTVLALSLPPNKCINCGKKKELGH